MTLTSKNAITLRKLTSKVTAEKGIPPYSTLLYLANERKLYLFNGKVFLLSKYKSFVCGLKCILHGHLIF